MAYLIAEGNGPNQRWRRKLVVGERHWIGRASGPWSTPWDDLISRRHIEIFWDHGRLSVLVNAEAKNPVFFRGHKCDQFFARTGEHFVIGKTTFTVADEYARAESDGPQPMTEMTFSPQDLRKSSFRDPDPRIAALSRLPEIISGSSSDSEMLIRLVNLLLTGIGPARAAAVASGGLRDQDVQVLHWDRRISTSNVFRPSARLIRRSLELGESVVHIWTKSAYPGEGEFTLSEGVDWAFCTPMPLLPTSFSSHSRWVIYVTGAFPDEAGWSAQSDYLRDDLKFTEFVAAVFGSLREAHSLTRRQASLSNFFSPIVLEAIGEADPDKVLAPKESQVSVLFCDLRGFSRKSEHERGNLLGLLERVSKSLGVMTKEILSTGGVVGDFHGDAAMGFWGWPIPQADRALRACRAAIAIRNEFASASSSEDSRFMADFQVGIGIASGNAVAGKIGTIDQVKVTVFGPVVNLASRLEGMTKTLRAPILIDQATMDSLRGFPLEGEPFRVRRVAKVRPYGMESELEIGELVGPAGASGELSNDAICDYEQGLNAFLSGDWKTAMQQLHKVPAEDLVKDFVTVFIAQNGRTPPPDWKGCIPMTSK